MMSSLRTPMLRALRRSRVGGVGLFVVLVLLVAGERRFAEIHFNARAAAPGLESDDVLDGDEIRVRLVVLNDDKAPTIADVRRALPVPVVHAVAQRCEFLARGRPAPRGPPSASSLDV